MAHDYKLAPVLDDTTNYIDWCKKLDVWVELTELAEGKKALAIFSSLRGKVKKAALQLEIKDLKVRGGEQYFHPLEVKSRKQLYN